MHSAPSFSMKRRQILRGKSTLDHLLKNGQRQRISFLQAIYAYYPLPHSQAPALLIGVSVGKRWIKKAITRNLMKRRLRESLRLSQHAIKEKIPEGKQLRIWIYYRLHTPIAFAPLHEKIRLLNEKLKYTELNTP